jgi:uncharacterized protein (DUF1697 family)
MAQGRRHVYVAFLRAVNVGGSGKLPMTALRSLVEAAGGTEVQTYIQSGNVVFGHRLRSGDKVGAALETALREEAGLTTSAMVFTGSELEAVIVENPFSGRPENLLHVAFFTRAPSPSEVAGAALERFSPEEAAVVGRRAYLFLPNGVGRAKLPTALQKVGVPSTLRNWRTVTTLAGMAGEQVT